MNVDKNLKIINKEKGSNEIFTINTRNLHKELGIKDDYSNWNKRLIKEFNLIVNVDYYLLHENVEQVSGTKHQKNYYVRPAIKDLIISKHNKGADKSLTEFASKVAELKNDPIKFVGYIYELMLKEQKEKKELQTKNETLTTNIKKLEGNDADVLFYIKDVGAELGISAIKLNRFLEEQKVIYKQNGHWHIYVKFAKEKLLIEVKEKLKNSNLYVSILKITPKGRIFIKDLWGKIYG